MSAGGSTGQERESGSLELELRQLPDTDAAPPKERSSKPLSHLSSAMITFFKHQN